MRPTTTHAMTAVVAVLLVLSGLAATGGPSGVAGASHGPPDADAGPDRQVVVGTNVTLDGSRTFDVGHNYRYVWVLVENPGRDELRRDTSITPTFRPSTTGTYVASLTVIDAQGRTASDRVTIEVTGTAAGRPALGAALSSGSVRPGERTNLSVTLVNNGTVDKRGVNGPSFTDRIGTARGLNVSIGRPGDPLRVLTGNLGIGSLPGGNTTSLAVPVVVAERARPGTYRIPVNVSYAYTPWIDPAGNETQRRVDVTLPIALTVEAAPRFRIVNVSTDLQVNDTDAVAVTLRNVGTAPATESTVSLASSNPDVSFGGAAGASRYVGRWPVGETRTVDIETRTSDAAAGQSYPVAVSVEWDDDGEVHSRTQTTSIVPRPEGSFTIEPTDSTLRVDATGRLAGTITNTGTDRVDNVVVALEEWPRTFVPRETEQVVGALEPGESATAGFDVEVAAEAGAGPHQVEVVARYRDAGGERRRSDQMALRTTVAPARPPFRVQAPDATVTAGDTAPVTLSVTNTGAETYRDLTVRVFPGGPLTAPTDTGSIATLAPGNATDVTVRVGAAGATPGRTYALAIDIRHDVGDETRFAGTYHVPVTVSASAATGGGIPTVVLLGGGLVLALVALWAYRRRR